jgi:hypothetical protein
MGEDLVALSIYEACFQIVLFSMLCLRDDCYYAAFGHLLDFKTDTGKSYMEFWDGFLIKPKLYIHNNIYGILLGN